MARTYVRDSSGIEQVLKSAEVARTIHRYAEQIATHARSSHPDAEEVVVDDYTTDRAASSVTVKDTRARGWQVQDGFLTRAAASAGLQVRANV